jgi:LAO/AO transport system kinase
VPEALNLADDQRSASRAEAIALLDTLEREAPYPGVPRIGLTGAPGAGKSTLLDALVRALRARDETVAIVAIDPSSRQTGGALLGDRIRMRSAGADDGVFIRSMAARDALGGTATGARAAVTILAAVFDRVVVETVGVGQSESDVTSLVDTLVFVASPGSGDAVQFMKAGVLEWPDVFAVNKSDLGAEAQRTASELQSGLALAGRSSDGWTPPVLATSARDGTGIDALLEAIDAHRAHIAADDTLRARRDAGREAHVVEGLRRRYGTHGLEQLGGERAVAERLHEDASTSAFAWLETLGHEVEDALRKQDP